MRRYLVASASVHATAAICDYLQARLSEDDTVIALGVHETDAGTRDVGDAINVAEVRLGPYATVEQVIRDGNPSAETLSVAAERDVDEIILGRRPAPADAGSSGDGTIRPVIEGADRPVVIVPDAEPSVGR